MLFSPGDEVIHRFQDTHGVYLLNRGEAQMLNLDEKVVFRQLFPGDALGAASLFVISPIKNTVKAKSYCQFYYLGKNEFENVMKLHGSEADVKEIANIALQKPQMKRFIGRQCSERGINMSSKLEVFMPNTSFRRVWSLLCFIGVAYNAYSIPMEIGYFFLPQGVNATNMLFLNYIVDVFFIVDMIMQLHFFAYDVEGVPVLEKSRIRSRYFRSGFFTDLISIIPLDLFVFLWGWQWLPVLRLNKLSRITHLVEYFQAIEALITEKNNVPTALRRMIKIFFILFMACHWAGCLWLFIGYLTEFNGETSWWVNYDNTDEI